MNAAALYLIDLEDSDNVETALEFFEGRLYGKSAFERNLQHLRLIDADVGVVVLCRGKLAEALRKSRMLRNHGICMPLEHEASTRRPTKHFVQNGEGAQFGVIYQKGLRLVTPAATLPVAEEAWEADRSAHEKWGSDIIDFIEPIRKAAGDFADRSGFGGRSVFLRCRYRFLPTGGREVRHFVEVPSVQLGQGGVGVHEELETILHQASQRRSFDGPFARYAFRRLSQVFSRPMAAIGLHPNTVTLLGAALACFALVAFAQGAWIYTAVGSFLWFWAGILDEVDGEVARLQARQSTFGAWLDLTSDRILDGAIILAIYWPIYRTTPNELVDLSVAIVLIVVLCSSYTGLLFDNWNKETLKRETYFRIGRDSRNAIIVFGGLLGVRLGVIWLVGTLGAFEIVRRMAICWYFERSVRRRSSQVGRSPSHSD